MKIRHELLWLIAIATLIFTFGLGSYALLDLDEPRYAEAAREMIDAKEYIVPLFNGEHRYDKPILFYWMEILSFKLFGINELAARLPSALAGIMLACVCYVFANFYRIGFLTALILISSLEVFVMSRLSVTDALLNLLMSATMLIWFLVYDQKISSKYLSLAGLSAGLALLCKGPVAIVLPGIIVVIFLLCRHRLLSFVKSKYRELCLASLTCLLVSMPWYLLVHYRTNGVFTQSFFFEHNLARYSSTLTGHAAAWWFYLLVIIVGFMPWTLYAAFRFTQMLLQRKLPVFQLSETSDLVLFSLVWIFSILTFFSFAQTKLPNYVLPLYMPLSLLLALHFKNILLSKKQWRVFCWSIAAIVLLYCLASQFVFKPIAKSKASGIIKFASMLDENSNLYLIKIIRPSVNFYSKKITENISFKEFLQRAKRKPKQCFVMKKNEKHKVHKENQIPLYIWLEDDRYIFACNYGLL